MDGLIWAASMVVLDASRRNHPVPRLAKWSLGVGIVATIGANLAHGLNHGPIGALVSAWPALALVGSFELLMLLIRKHHQADADPKPTTRRTTLRQIWHRSNHPWRSRRRLWKRRCETCTPQATASAR